MAGEGLFKSAFKMPKNMFNSQKNYLNKKAFVWQKKIKIAFKNSKSLKIVKIHFLQNLKLFFDLKIIFLKRNLIHNLSRVKTVNN